MKAISAPSARAVGEKEFASFLIDPVDRAIWDERWRGEDELELFQLAQFSFQGIKRVNRKNTPP